MKKKLYFYALYDIGDMVFVKTDINQDERQITGILLLPEGQVKYQLSCDGHIDFYHEIELTLDKDLSKIQEP